MIEIHDWPEWQDHDASLVSTIMYLNGKHPDSKLGVGTGWCSPKIMQDFPPVEPFIEWAAERIGTPYSRVHVWANVLRKYQSIGPHDHYQAVGCGVFYLHTEGSSIRFGKDEYLPKDGQLITFGPLDVHEVPPYEGVEPRTSISINLYE